MLENLQWNIKERLDRKSLSVSRLEKKAGLRPSAVQNILHGRSRRPSLDVVYAIAQELGCSLEDLMNAPEETQPSQKKTDDPKHPDKSEVISLNVSLAKRVFDAVCDEVTKHQQTIHNNLLYSIMEEVYNFCEKTKREYVDAEFVSWFTQRILEKNKKAGNDVKL